MCAWLKLNFERLIISIFLRQPRKPSFTVILQRVTCIYEIYHYVLIISCEKSKKRLTSDHHHGHGEDLLDVRVGRDVPEADAGQAGHGEVQRGDVDRVLAGPALPLAAARHVEPVRLPRRLAQQEQPAVHPHAVGDLVDDLVVADAEPDAGQPVGRQAEHAHQQEQHGGAILDVVVQLPGDPAQAQQADHFEGAEEAADPLGEGEEEEEEEEEMRRRKKKGGSFIYYFFLNKIFKPRAASLRWIEVKRS